MAFEPSKHVNGRTAATGVSGNPNGRPVGSRTVFSQSFLKDLASVWAERGRAVFGQFRSAPSTYAHPATRHVGQPYVRALKEAFPCDK